MDNTAFLNQVVLQVAERLRDHATRQGVIPFLTGDLRKSVQATLVSFGQASVGSNLSYARAVHDGRPALVIRPKNKKALWWGPRTIGGRSFTGIQTPIDPKTGKPRPVKEVHQKARKAKPFLQWAARNMEQEGYGFLYPFVRQFVEEEVARQISGQIKIEIKF